MAARDARSRPIHLAVGKLHRVSFAHALALQKPLDQVFNRGPFPIGGDTDTPCQTAFFAHVPTTTKPGTLVPPGGRTWEISPVR